MSHLPESSLPCVSARVHTRCHDLFTCVCSRRYKTFDHQSNLAEFLAAVKEAGAVAGGGGHASQLEPGASYRVPADAESNSRTRGRHRRSSNGAPRPSRRRSVPAPLQRSLAPPARVPIAARIRDVVRLDVKRQKAATNADRGSRSPVARRRSPSRSPMAASPTRGRRSGSLPPLRPVSAGGGGANPDADPLIRAAKRAARRSTPAGREPRDAGRRSKARGKDASSTAGSSSGSRTPRRRSAEPRPARGPGSQERNAKRRSGARRNRRAST